MLESFGRRDFRAVLAEWRRVLKPGGLLRLAVPDFAACAKLYHERGLADGLNGLIWGGQRDGMDDHKMIFDEPFLKHELQGLGFGTFGARLELIHSVNPLKPRQAPMPVKADLNLHLSGRIG
ncbi:hypothetical protein Thi970DRAFT_03416 [Thiorhodovibrio frisius]|uniref:Methylase involved in ubiquinone/menaquinone biosynthesis n=1 Tax=Thiorhodovibrio frisius TaxID=631362 RepID=H8Z797_9GAMM|nr:hypothetical protein Thi970DRAFT_03416 [Thiorhodovibrio frisius]WPL20209.1 hypothetical protein Thiofri_00283 [Thiorhodovibrio frisius]